MAQCTQYNQECFYASRDSGECQEERCKFVLELPEKELIDENKTFLDDYESIFDAISDRDYYKNKG